MLSGYVASLIDVLGIRDVTYVEPYAGGAGVALRLLKDHKVSKVVINDYDPDVFAFWNSAVNDSASFLERFDRAEPTIEEWHRQKRIIADPASELDRGFAFFFLNRTNRSGVLNGGVIGGLKQNGRYKVSARYNKASLRRKLEFLREHGDDGRSRDDVMDGPASPPDESGRILDPFRKAFVWTRTRLNLSGEIFGTPQCPVARILTPVLTVLGASILVCDLFESPWREVLAFAALAAALFSVGYRPHPLDALRRPGKPMRWFLCLGCVLVLPVVTFYISALLVSLIPDTSENAGIAETDTFGEYVVMFIQIMGEACLSILLFAVLYKALNRAWGRSDPWVRPLVAWLVSAFLFGMPHLPTYRWNFLQCLVIFFSLFLGFAAFVATRSWTILFLSHFLYDLLSRPLVLNACRHAALLWLLVAVACVYWHFGSGSASRSGFPFRSPDIGGLSGGWHATAGGIAGRGIGCVHADRSPLPEGVPAVGPMMGKERG